MADQKTGAAVRDYIVTRLGQAELALVTAFNDLSDIQTEATGQGFGLTAAWSEDTAIKVEHALDEVRRVHEDYLKMRL